MAGVHGSWNLRSLLSTQWGVLMTHPTHPLSLGPTYLLQFLCGSDIFSFQPPGVFLPLLPLNNPFIPHMLTSWWAPGSLSHLPHPPTLESSWTLFIFPLSKLYFGFLWLSPPYHHFQASLAAYAGARALGNIGKTGRAPLYSASPQSSSSNSPWPVLQTSAQGYLCRVAPRLGPSKFLPYCPKSILFFSCWKQTHLYAISSSHLP